MEIIIKQNINCNENYTTMEIIIEIMFKENCYGKCIII